MQPSDAFWSSFELDFQEIKIAYLNWAMTYFKPPLLKHKHLFTWDHQTDLCLIDSRYGRTFSISPFGTGVRGVPRKQSIKFLKGIDDTDLALKNRLSNNTRLIRQKISDAINRKDIEDARSAVLNYYWIKLGPHEILFDHIQYGENHNGKITKGKHHLLEPESHKTLPGIRNKIINTIRYGGNLDSEYVLALNKKLPGFSSGAMSTFLSSSMTWNRYGLCTFDCGPILWSKKGFVHFDQIQTQMDKIEWPYKGTASELLRPLYTIGLNYRRPPIRIRDDPHEGYCLKSLRSRAYQIYEILDRISEQIHHRRQTLLNQQ